MLCVGLTGNIASGKSTVANLFKEKGVAVISADEIARELTCPGEPAYHQIKAHFGKSILNEHGELNRRLLREKVFKSTQDKIWLEALLHPLIRQDIHLKRLASKGPYVLIEIPLLEDKSLYPYLNRILVVLADSKEQIKRLIERDQCSEDIAEAILTSQPKEIDRRNLADDILLNQGSLEKLRKEVDLLHSFYLKLSKSI